MCIIYVPLTLGKQQTHRGTKWTSMAQLLTNGKMNKYQISTFEKLPKSLKFHLQSKQVYFTSLFYPISTKSKFVQSLTPKKNIKEKTNFNSKIH